MTESGAIMTGKDFPANSERILAEVFDSFDEELEQEFDDKWLGHLLEEALEILKKAVSIAPSISKSFSGCNVSL